MSAFRVIPVGDACLSVVFDEIIDPEINARCTGLADALEKDAPAGVLDIVTAYHAVSVYFDPRTLKRQTLAGELERMAAARPAAAVDVAAALEIPVTYGGEAGPDLPAVADFAGCTEDDVVRMHTAVEYRVYMLGFVPGFAYLGAVDRRIAMPRLDTPRLKVPAGSVGIAGEQTGIYPCETPGGWRIIGRTAMKPFDLARPEPFLFKPGQRVKFVAQA